MAWRLIAPFHWLIRFIGDGHAHYLHDVNVLDMLTFEAGAFYVMDRGYADFARQYALHQAGAFVVMRAKSPKDARRVYSAAADRGTGVISDQRVMLNGYYSAEKNPEYLRRIRFKDPESGKTPVFLTNNTVWPKFTIAALQVWCGVANYLLIAIVKKEFQLDASLYTRVQILSVSLFKNTHKV